MVHLNWTSESIRWLSDIFDYISEENPVAAEAVVAGIFQRAQILLSHPKSVIAAVLQSDTFES